MNIRSITVFINPSWPLDFSQFKHAGDFMQFARQAYARAGYAVQTTRLATVPFPELLRGASTEQLVAFSQEIEKAASAVGFEYISLGPALPDQLDWFKPIPDALASTQSVFFSGLMTQPDGAVSMPAVRNCAQVISRNAFISSDGFANLRFAALANVPAGSPFFPAAYHKGNLSAFALALEAAVLAVDTFSTSETLDQACQALKETVESHARSLVRVSRSLQVQYGYDFKGLDFSLAPYPERTKSLGEAVERLGVPAVGLHGSLAANALIANCLDQARFPRAGFNGLFLPVLEDAVLAERAAEGTVSIKDLLLYSAVCGAGLDTIPLPGDTPIFALEAVLLDLAVLAQRLNKPLTARLMPIPGKKAGDPTEFDFSYFAGSRVMSLNAQPLSGILAKAGRVLVKPWR